MADGNSFIRRKELWAMHLIRNSTYRLIEILSVWPVSHCGVSFGPFPRTSCAVTCGSLSLGI